MSEIVSEAWRKFLIQLQSHPLSTKAITAGVLVGLSDGIAQKISGIKKLQLRRMFLMMLYGFAYTGPFGHFLHKLMDIIFRAKKVRRTIKLSQIRFSSGAVNFISSEQHVFHDVLWLGD